MHEKPMPYDRAAELAAVEDYLDRLDYEHVEELSRRYDKFRDALTAHYWAVEDIHSLSPYSEIPEDQRDIMMERIEECAHAVLDAARNYIEAGGK